MNLRKFHTEVVKLERLIRSCTLSQKSNGPSWTKGGTYYDTHFSHKSSDIRFRTLTITEDRVEQ